MPRRNDSISSLRGSAKHNEAINKKVDCHASLRSARNDEKNKISNANDNENSTVIANESEAIHNNTEENLKNTLLGKNAKDILEFSKIYSLPIDIKYILRDKLEININDNLDWDRLALDGCVYLNNKGYPKIWINSSIPENR